MFRESFPIIYEAPADLKKWPSLNGERLNGKTQPYLVFNGTLADCIRELLAKPVKPVRHRHRASSGVRPEGIVSR
jgi:hypothetical protein